jgi:hypothetical protein
MALIGAILDLSSEALGAAVTEFRTRPDGTRYPITPKKGAVVAGALLAGVLAAGGGGLGGTAAGNAVAGVGVQARVASAKPAARQGKRTDALQRVGLRSPRDRIEIGLECVANSYGDVRLLFIAMPCRSLDRALLLVADDTGATLLLSIYWVRMRTAATAIALRDLADTYGSGNVSPIAAPLLGLADVRFTGRYYDSRRSGALVVIAETEPMSGSPSEETLLAVADLAVEFPPPG